MSDDSSAHRLAQHLRSVIATEPAGAALPSTRKLSAAHSAGPATVQRAVAMLVAEGLVDTRPGSGNFVAPSRVSRSGDFSWQTTTLGASRVGPNPIGSSMRSDATDVVALHGGYPTDDLLPTALVRQALVRAARGPHAVQRPPTAGLPELREWFAADLSNTGSPSVMLHRSDVLITPGGQSALSSVFRALASPGDSVVMESPTYWGAIAAAQQAGLTIVPVARTTGAPDPGDLEAAITRSGARLFYAQPTFANPTGACWSADERSVVMDLMRAHGAFLVEDDWAHDFDIDSSGPATAPLAASDDHGHVVHIRSLTKSLSPALRIAAVIARGPARRRIETDRTVDDLYVSGVLQAAAADVLTRVALTTHRKSLRAKLRERRDAMVDAVTAAGLEITAVPRGGLHLWIRLPEDCNAESLAARCLTRGVAVSPGDEWFPAEPPAQFLRLSYAGAPTTQFADAAAIVAKQTRTRLNTVGS